MWFGFAELVQRMIKRGSVQNIMLIILFKEPNNFIYGWGHRIHYTGVTEFKIDLFLAHPVLMLVVVAAGVTLTIKALLFLYAQRSVWS